jgi:hypothetical protein
MNHEVIFLTEFVAAVVTGEPFDALVDLPVLLEIALLIKGHVAHFAGEGSLLSMAVKVRVELGERQ